ncbi:MAG: hypothetical protein R3Y22_05700 [Bacteroidales bacterium]
MNIIDEYKTRVAGLAEEVERIRVRFAYLYLARFVTFLVAVGCVLLAFSGDCEWWEVTLAVGSFIAFLVLVKVDSIQSAKREFLQRKLEVNREELRVIDFDFANRGDGAEYAHISPYLMADFDIVGRGSLFQYLNRSVTRKGERLFIDNLCREELDADMIRLKQQAIKELAEKVEFVQDFHTRGSFFEESDEEFKYLQRWTSEREDANCYRVVKALSILVPAISIVWLGLYLTGVLAFSTIWGALIVNIILSSWNMRAINRNHARLGRATKVIKKYSQLIAMLEGEEFKSEYLNRVKGELSVEGSSASVQICKLRKLLNLFDNRNNLFSILVLNGVYGFNVQIFRNLLSWKERYGAEVERWINAISEFDALLGYGVYAYNNRGVTTSPIINDGDKFSIEAKGMAHPLISDKVCVANDISITKSPAIIIITGANMAGKSTFLRTVAVNMILGMNGSVVAASGFSFTPAKILSSIKIQDSLAKNESYFYAEISRLRDIVDMVNADGLKLVVLDEILRGTNNKDKQIGSLGLLQKLINNNAIVFIATHDLVIGELEQQYPDVARNYCFEVELEDNKLLFDYKLKDGVSQKLNASFLLRDMGLID